MDVLDLPLEQIIPYARNPRNNAQAIATVAASIQEFGWRQPIVVDEAMVVLAGHTRLEAARKLGFKSAPVHVAKGLTEAQARAFRIMDNRSSENAEWDKDLLNLELADLFEIELWILSRGSHAKVLGPAKLKNSIRKHAEAILET